MPGAAFVESGSADGAHECAEFVGDELRLFECEEVTAAAGCRIPTDVAGRAFGDGTRKAIERRFAALRDRHRYGDLRARGVVG